MSTLDDAIALAARAREGRWGPLARAITMVENSPPWDVAIPAAEQPCQVVGITGPPGAGKSTLAGRLIESFGDAGSRVAVLAIDPSSAVTGGAVLGDRIRMETHLGGRPDVFVRSLASRGSHGALAGATRNVARLLEHCGLFDVILIETVGAGQTEIAIVDLADTVLLVTVPGLGDAVQAIKAGLMEIADLFVVNMGDRPGAHETVRHLRLAARSAAVHQTIATEGVGVEELRIAIESRWRDLVRNEQVDAMRGDKLNAEATVMAQGWLESCAASLDLGTTSTIHDAVGRVLKEADARWTR